MKKVVSCLLALSLAASAVMLSACGDKSNNNNTQTSQGSQASHTVSKADTSTEASVDDPEVSVDSSKPGITETQLASLNEKIADSQKMPEFTCKSEKINASEIAKNKTISLIAENSGSSYHAMLEKTFKRTAERIGFKKVNAPETDGTVSKLNDALTASVNVKSDLIFLSGDIQKNENISSNIEIAQANGIEVYSSGSKGLDEADHFVDYTVPINYGRAGELMADWGIVKTGGKINALVVNCTDSELSGSIFKGFKTEFEKYVSSSDGSCTVVNANALEIGNGLSSMIKSALDKDSAINYIFVCDDNAINDSISAAVQSGHDVKVVATGGSTEDMDYAQSGSIEMLVSHSFEWTAYAMLDYAMRAMSDAELPKEQDVPFRIITKASIKKESDEYSGDFDTYAEICYGDAFITGYNGLWGLA